MLIDWFTVGAQVLNFLILVWLLKRFLYQPILDAIDAREQRIASALADAEANKAEAKQERDAFRRKNEAFEGRRAALLSQATDAATAERLRLLDEARRAADALRDKRRDALRREQRSLSDEIARRTQEEVFAIARKTLKDLAGIPLEERMSQVFARRLRELDHEAKAGFLKAPRTSSDPLRVRSAFELPEEQRAVIRDALEATFSADVQVLFETAPEVIGGIELSANGRKIAWSIADYLAALENSVGAVLAEPSKLQAEPEARPNSGAPAEAQ